MQLAVTPQAQLRALRDRAVTAVRNVGTVGVLTTSFPRFAGDAAGSFVAEMLAAMAVPAGSVQVIAAADRAAGMAEFVDGFHVRRIQIRPGLFYRGGAPDALSGAGARQWLGAGWFTARLAKEVMLAGRRWDGIIAHWLVPSAIAAFPTSGPLLAIAHGGDVHLLSRLGLLGVCMSLLRRRNARVVFVANCLREQAVAASDPATARWLQHALVQPMGIDVTRFCLGRPAPASRPTVLVLARLVPIKGVAVAIESLRSLRRPVRLVIAGAGPLRAELESQAMSLACDRIPSSIEFVGDVTAIARDRLLGDASVVVVPSITHHGRSEGTPRVALEALAAGRPVIVSRTGGLAELPESPAIRVATPGSPTELAAGIELALDADQFQEASRIGATYAWESVAARLVAHWLSQEGASEGSHQ